MVARPRLLLLRAHRPWVFLPVFHLWRVLSSLPQPTSPRPVALGRASHWLAVALFLLLALVYYLPSLHWLPRGIHEWAQADRLALAISFYDNGLHFFRPQTLNLSALDGVVGVEFPLMAWLAALLAKLTGRSSIGWWFRLLDSGVALVGYYFLFRLVAERTGHFWLALLPGVFLATAPAFAYYAGNYLPDPVGVSLVLVASYFLLRFGQQGRFADLGRALLLYTLATLIKTSAGTYQVAAIGLVLLWSLLRPQVLSPRQRLVFLGLSAASLGVVVAYASYNKHLNQVHHSFIFLAQARPLTTGRDLASVLHRMATDWRDEYFTPVHYLLLAGSAGVCVRFGRVIGRTEWLWASFLSLAAVGGGVFFLLMGLQFADHDYYALAPYYPGLALLVALAAVQLASWYGPASRPKAGPRPLSQRLGPYALAVAIVSLVALGLRHYRIRITDPYRPYSDYYRYRWMQGGAAALAAARVPARATLLVLGEEAPNLPLVYFDRRGRVWNPDLAQLTPTALAAALRRDGLDYVLVSQEVFRQLPAMPGYFRPMLRTSQFVLLAPTATFH